MLHVVLHQPEIPQNTGSIGRLCVNNDCCLHLIKPLGFDITDYYLRRAGLDYWEKLNPTLYEDYEDFVSKNGTLRKFFFTTKGKKRHTEIDWQENDALIFGCETSGLPQSIIDSNLDRTLRIPMLGDYHRSLNLAQAVAIGVYEGLRKIHLW